jgi:hypothetical protein
MWATLATILNVFKRCQKEDVDQYQKVPLEEEWKLYGLDSMSLFHAPIDFESVPAPSNVSILNSIRIASNKANMAIGWQVKTTKKVSD